MQRNVTGPARPSDQATARPLDELRSSGLLWLINATVFHPRGLALALITNDAGMIVGWRLLGDGREPWQFNDGPGLDDLFAAAHATMVEAMLANGGE
jgi:hypothetical protein